MQRAKGSLFIVCEGRELDAASRGHDCCSFAAMTFAPRTAVKRERNYQHIRGTHLCTHKFMLYAHRRIRSGSDMLLFYITLFSLPTTTKILDHVDSVSSHMYIERATSV